MQTIYVKFATEPDSSHRPRGYRREVAGVFEMFIIINVSESRLAPDSWKNGLAAPRLAHAWRHACAERVLGGLDDPA
jgi:hypothetical protein